MNKIIYIISILLIGVMTYNGYLVSETISGITSKQESNTNELVRWKNAYEALIPVEQKWEETFNQIGEVGDLIDLYDAIGLNNSLIEFDYTNLVVSNLSEVSYKGDRMGLAQICINSKRGRNLTLPADSISATLEGIEELENRIDMNIETIELKREQNEAVFILNNFCTLLRG